ncbi:hypothetical protein KKG29_01905 [Patescibacteria group bacterium]|nr:hypothetical protein [Patescibacteria group bacterium]MBU3999912.1 hypothetical protein [Patescibacteria group bacterium]MBU4056782.1 hypothetical protein [Patescibacteria group bacterium]MBU4368918.1 hypothetical protein [Patescibacteria group bacterium]
MQSVIAANHANQIAAIQNQSNQSEANQTSEPLRQTPQNAAQPKEPGIEAVFAIAGLFAVAYFVLRQRK